MRDFYYKPRSLFRHHRVIKAVVRQSIMTLEACVAQRSILVTPKSEYRLIHLLGIENLQPEKQVEILHR